ncbi:LuxR family transcriptional regulator [Pararhizobium polonicum]|jgi:DNA-binding CsgD family transcriptional regulator|uniref:LuxR family transcriptional regulator n=1 Tax=Pararhizobium polonicum TaxID=1612624 RepID=A0A1C7NVV4_9HYPH|nr:LuxR family transcriptional regulator [Pararhizobium polonicum]OBZ92816.1 LuxR family transcriptional regulator [Pararhizobium polonicum]
MVDFSGYLSSIALPAAQRIAETRRIAETMTREADVRQALEQVMRAYGFQGFMVMVVPGKACRSLSEAVVMTNWPKDFLASYDAASLMAGSPVIERLRRSTIPFTYDTTLDSHMRADGKGNAVLRLFERGNLRRGVYIPTHDVHGTCGAVAFAGNREAVNPGELKELTFMAGYLFSRLSELKEMRSRVPGGLSRREIECLHWAAAGKTTTEMAKILALSEYTVNHYLSRATRKLDSVNRVQTVAKAIRAGLIN